jgi:AbrB family looped-hinge helix DNA binding protein
VIPSRLRRKFGIKKGTQVYVYERDGEIAIRPITDDYIRNMAGMAGTKGKLLKALMEEKAMSANCESRRHPFRFHPSSSFLAFLPPRRLTPLAFFPLTPNFSE